MIQPDRSGQQHELDPQRWVEIHGDVLMGYAMLRVRDRDLAEDLVQETLVAAWNARDRFEGRGKERTWLVGILKRRIFDFYRRRWREQPATALSADADGDQMMDRMFDEKGMWKDEKPQVWADPRRALDGKEFMEYLELCLKKLPARLAEAFTLREMEEVDGNEICQALGISATNLWQMIHRARAGLRRCLEKNGFGSLGKE
ncbi:MAG: sigma-70 family RNA polymerase sigma factor [bacterium]|nr:sigma-70 family RNA polymerase sigma factor [bacterium]